ncbi:MAG: hypothetical protein ACI86M_001793 [Saprospiraceae bacterium]|jgi:hypothetical protein
MKNYILTFAVLISQIVILSAQFSEQVVVYSGIDEASEVFASDINNDGLNDLIGCTETNLLLFINLGNHLYSTVTLESTPGANFSSAHTADLDADGLTDIVSSSEGNGNISWYKNLGNNTFSPKNIIDSGNKSRDVITADLDGDGDLDVLANLYQSFATDLIAYYENTGNGSFDPRVILSSEGSRIDCLLPFDIDDDGDLDVFSTDLIGDQIWMMENLGNGSFGSPSSIAQNLNGAQSLTIADYDKDGRYDFVVATRNSASMIATFSYNSDGTFTIPERIFFIITNSQINTVYFKDLDLDGNPEICMADDNASTISYLKNLGTAFQGSATMVYASATRASCVHADDLDGDGDSEVIYSLGEGKEIGYFINSTIISSTKEALTESINIYPNPSSEYITVDIDVNTIQQLLIFGIDGAKYLEKSDLSDSNIDISSFAAGTYILLLKTTDGDYTQTFVKN